MKTIDIQLTNNFKLSEFCTTSQDFENFHLSLEYFENIRQLAILLQKLRTTCRFPIRVSSGYRPERLNTMVDGVKDSFHLVGAAADIYFNDIVEFETAWKFLISLYYNHYIDGKPVIAELLGSSDSRWLHVSINCPQRRNKHIINQKYY